LTEAVLRAAHRVTETSCFSDQATTRRWQYAERSDKLDIVFRSFD